MDYLENPPAVNPLIGEQPFSSGADGVSLQSPNPMKVQSAMMAMLDGANEDALASYQRLQANQADSSPDIMAQLQKRSLDSLTQLRQALPDVMADPTIPFEQKEKVLNANKSGQVEAPDSAVALAQSASLRPGGKDRAGESTYDIMHFWSERQREQSERQAIMNSVNAHKDGTLKKVGDIVGLFAPMADSYMMANLQGTDVAKKLGMDGAMYASVMPGSWFQEFSEKLDKLPFDEKTAAMKAIAGVIKESSSLMTSDNSFRTLATIGDINSGDFGTFDKILMNTVAILDVLGIPAMIRGTASLAVNVPKAVAKAAKAKEGVSAAEALVRGGKDIPIDAAKQSQQGLVGDVVKADYTRTYDASDMAATTATPQRSRNQHLIDQLEDNRKSILGEPTEPLSSGQVTKLSAEREKLVAQLEAMRTMPSDSKRGGTSIELKKTHQGIAQDVEARIHRIEDTLQTNRAAENNLQVLTDIDSEIKALRKADTMEDIPLNPVAEQFRQAYVQGTFYTHNPRTVSNVLMNSNPDEARKVHSLMLMDETDESAIAMTGVGRNEALVQAVAPQVSTAGRVRWVAPDIEQNIRGIILSQDATAVIKNADGGLRYSLSEIEKGRAQIVHDYTDVTGLELHPAMSSIQSTADGNNVFVQGIYMKPGGEVWTTPEKAIEQASFSLKHRGATAEDFTILAREGDDFVPRDLKDVAGKAGEYLIGIKSNHIVEDADIGPLDHLNVKWNFMDSLQRTGDNKHGSIQSHILPSANMLHEQLTGAATVAVDRTSVLAEALLEKLDRVTTPFMGLNKERRAMVEDYWVEANTRELAFDTTDLVARGFDGNEINIMRNFRDFQDILHDLENLDVVRSLKADNYGWFEGTNLKVAVKNQTKRADYNVKMVYDDMNDVYRPIDDIETKSIYNGGGYVAELRHPVTIGGDRISHVIVRNNPQEYTRVLKDTDKILMKKDGYFQTIHKGAQYVEAHYLGPDGKEIKEVVAVAGSTKEAKYLREQFQSKEPSKQFIYRGDEKSITRGSNEYWQLNTVGGRIAQRHRSKLIESTVNAGNDLHIEKPIESAIRATQSISGRIAMRPSLDTAKKRFMDQYGNFVAPDAMGQRRFPNTLDQIVAKGDVGSKEIRDARTTWNYIQAMENGYVNLVDVGVRSMFRKFADIAGEANLVGTERALREGEAVNVTAKVKSAVFTAYLATAPWRQWLVQGNQGLRAIGYNPVGFVSGSVYHYFQTPVKGVFKSQLSHKQEGFSDFMKSTGLYQSISKNNLIRGSMMDASERRGTVGGIVDGGLGTMRKVGFDAGEHFNLWAHGAAVYDQYVRKGANVKDARVQAEMASTIRALTYDMNYAGDMPYNQNTMSLFMTYMQIPHKAIAVAGNRRLPGWKRFQMAVFDYAMWGLPAGLIKAAYGDDYEQMGEESRRLAIDGVEAWALNKLFTEIAGERVAGDWTALSPFGTDGWVNLAQAAWSGGGFSEVLTSSATGKLLADGNGRVWMAAKMTLDYFKDFREGSAVTADPTELVDVFNAWASVSSGWNALQKARAQYMMGYAIDKRGGITDDSVNKTEAYLAAFGIGTEDSRDYYEVMKAANKSPAKSKADGAGDADMLARLIVMKNPTADQSQIAKLFMQSMFMHKNMLDPTAATAYWKGATETLFKPANYKIWEKLTKEAGLLTSDEYKDKIMVAPIPAAEKAMLMKAYSGSREAYKSMGYGPK
mgnify:FL=1